MKYKTMMEKFYSMNLQLFADDPAPDDDGDGGDDPDDDDDDDDEGDDPDEKKYSQKDIDDAVKKRLAREKRKWQREHKKKAEPDGKGKAGEDDKKDEDDKETKELKDKAAKADDLELKWTCLEHDVDKSCVDDVLALAKVHMAKDEDMDIEDAIDEVLKKYPQFKVGSSKEEEDEDETEKKKSWGQRQKSGGNKKLTGVEAAFLKQNPGLKID